MAKIVQGEYDQGFHDNCKTSFMEMKPIMSKVTD